MMITRRAVLVNILFAAVLVLIGNLAWATAVQTTGPWYDATISMVMYGLSLPLAIILAVVLAVTTARWVSHLNEALRSLDARIAILGGKGTRSRSSSNPPGMSVDGGLRDVIREIKAASADADPSTGAGSEVLVQVTGPAASRATRARLETMVELVSQRLQLRRARQHAWWTVAGPLVVSFAFAAIAGAMLPGSGGPAQTDFRLNTTLILLLAYSWWIVVAWAVASLQLLHAQPDRPGPSRRSRTL